MTLYKLTEEFLQLMDMAEDPDIDSVLLADTMEAIEGEIEYKAEGCAKVIRSLDATEEALANEIKRLQKRKKAISNNRDAIKRNLAMAMNATGKRKFDSGVFKFSIRKNPKALILDSDNIVDFPPEFLIAQAPKIDEKAIKDALKAGEKFSFAHLEQGESLIIT